jgi:predicted RecA/RadA family phage recombinase
MQAEFIRGNPLMPEYTPGADHTAGDVIVVGEVTRIAHRDLKTGILGALAAGGGEYRVGKATGGGTAIASGKLVYWDDTGNVVTETASTHKVFGVTTSAAADADAYILVQHLPIVVVEVEAEA